MTASYEFWLEDDTGARITEIDGFFSASFSRSVMGIGAFQMEISYEYMLSKINPVFMPDWRISCWRSAGAGYPMVLLRTYLLRGERIYVRQDGVYVLQYIGRDAMDLLNRRWVIQNADPLLNISVKTGGYDAIMKQIVYDQMVYGFSYSKDGATLDSDRAYPQYEFTVDDGYYNELARYTFPTPYKTFNDRNVLDVLKELRDESIIKANIYGIENSYPCYFDVIERDIPQTGKPGWVFKVFFPHRGNDITSGSLVFSVENENLKEPDYQMSYLDEVNSVYVKSGVMISPYQDANRVGTTRWNLSESVKFSLYDPTGQSSESAANYELRRGAPKESLDAILVSIPENDRVPRCLYGVDWNFGDYVNASFAGKQFKIDIKIVYFSINEKGEEKITARNRVN